MNTAKRILGVMRKKTRAISAPIQAEMRRKKQEEREARVEVVLGVIPHGESIRRANHALGTDTKRNSRRHSKGRPPQRPRYKSDARRVKKAR